jgi:glycerol-3-phosphate dehydrogenase
MRRDLSQLADTAFDLLVVGAGIHGACAAWDASLRGLSVAVVDRDDFGAATSANSLRIVHGGLRYLARGDFPRMQESIQERSALLRIAPELVEPLPVLVATHGIGARSRLAHRIALALNDVASLSRNRGLEPGRRLPRSRLVSRDECLDLFSGYRPGHELTGGALWYDAQLRHPERLTLGFLRSAVGRGAVAANYLRVDRLRVANGTVGGALATDIVNGARLEIRARAVLVAAGPWTSGLVAGAGAAAEAAPAPRYALGVNLILGRRLADVAVGVQALTSRNHDPVMGGRRFLFLAPRGTTTLLGTWYTIPAAGAIEGEIDRGVGTLLQELNEACPELAVSSADVVRHQWGWLPLKSGIEPGRADALADRPRVLDHGASGGIRHLFSAEGVKYTTARRVAERAVDLVFDGLGQSSPRCLTSVTALDMGSGPEVLHAVREDMAITLADIVFRRTSLGEAPGPDRASVEAAAHIAGAELGWDALRQEAEVDDVMRQSTMPGAPVETVR